MRSIAVIGAGTLRRPAYRAELDAFVAAVLDGKPAAPTGEDGLKALLLADAATESARTGRPVTIA